MLKLFDKIISIFRILCSGLEYNIINIFGSEEKFSQSKNNYIRRWKERTVFWGKKIKMNYSFFSLTSGNCSRKVN